MPRDRMQAYPMQADPMQADPMQADPIQANTPGRPGLGSVRRTCHVERGALTGE